MTPTELAPLRDTDAVDAELAQLKQQVGLPSIAGPTQAAPPSKSGC